MRRIAVIGGGASGLMAALHAAGGDNRVSLFEKQNKVGRKILVSGNGRCNITNRGVSPERYHGNNPKFVNSVLSRFGLADTIEFFQSLGLPTVEEDDGRMYPASLQSVTVVKILEYELERRGVEIHLHRKIDRITDVPNGYRLVTAGREEHDADAVILAAGSCAYPPAGGSRDGYDLARQLRHTIREPFPAILPINVPLKILHRLQGIKWNCSATVHLHNRALSSSEGEILFTAYGISGPVSLDISRAVNEQVRSNAVPTIVIDLFPGYRDNEMRELLERLWKDGSKNLAFSLIGILRTPMHEVLPIMAGIDPKKRVGDVTRGEKQALLETLKRLTLKPGKPRSFNEAVVAAGGVSVDEIKPITMESKISRNCYITGELLDIDGDSGGFNLQFAWSTGAIAGMSQHGSGRIRTT